MKSQRKDNNSEQRKEIISLSPSRKPPSYYISSKKEITPFGTLAQKEIVNCYSHVFERGDKILQIEKVKLNTIMEDTNQSKNKGIQMIRNENQINKIEKSNYSIDKKEEMITVQKESIKSSNMINKCLPLICDPIIQVSQLKSVGKSQLIEQQQGEGREGIGENQLQNQTKEMQQIDNNNDLMKVNNKYQRFIDQDITQNFVKFTTNKFQLINKQSLENNILQKYNESIKVNGLNQKNSLFSKKNDNQEIITQKEIDNIPQLIRNSPQYIYKQINQLNNDTFIASLKDFGIPSNHILNQNQVEESKKLPHLDQKTIKLISNTPNIQANSLISKSRMQQIIEFPQNLNEKQCQNSSLQSYIDSSIEPNQIIPQQEYTPSLQQISKLKYFQQDHSPSGHSYKKSNLKLQQIPNSSIQKTVSNIYSYEFPISSLKSYKNQCQQLIHSSQTQSFQSTNMEQQSPKMQDKRNKRAVSLNTCNESIDDYNLFKQTPIAKKTKQIMVKQRKFGNHFQKNNTNEHNNIEQPQISSTNNKILLEPLLNKIENTILLENELNNRSPLRKKAYTFIGVPLEKKSIFDKQIKNVNIDDCILCLSPRFWSPFPKAEKYPKENNSSHIQPFTKYPQNKNEEISRKDIKEYDILLPSKKHKKQLLPKLNSPSFGLSSRRNSEILKDPVEIPVKSLQLNQIGENNSLIISKCKNIDDKYLKQYVLKNQDLKENINICQDNTQKEFLSCKNNLNIERKIQKSKNIFHNPDPWEQDQIAEQSNWLESAIQQQPSNQMIQSLKF